MLRSLKSLKGYKIFAKDGDIGEVHDFFFNENDWSIKYLVVDTGRWLPGRKVLISPLSFGQPDQQTKRFPLSLTRDQIKRSPDINLNEPFSRKQLNELSTYYGWPEYTSIGRLHGTPESHARAMEAERGGVAVMEAEELYLLGTKDILDYSIEATDGELGEVEDFIIDDSNWTIRYMEIDTGRWLPGKKVLASPAWVRGINRDDKNVLVDLSQSTIKNSPEYDPSKPITRDYETKLFSYYGRPGYWQ